MKTLPKPVLLVAFAVLAGFAIHEARRAAQLLEQNQALQAQLIPAQEQIGRLQHEHHAMNRRLASQSADQRELLKLNQEVQRLRKLAGSNDMVTAAITNESDRLQEEAVKVMRRRHIDWTIDGKLLGMKRRLNLTAEQETAMRGVLERLCDPDKRVESYVDAKKHYDADLAAFLSSDQLAVVSQMEKDEKLNEEQRTVRGMAEVETQQLGDNLDLSPEQQTAVAAAVLQFQMKTMALQSALGGNLTQESWLPFRNEKLQALKDILTDEQFAIYKKFYDEETRELELFEAAEKVEKPKKP